MTDVLTNTTDTPGECENEAHWKDEFKELSNKDGYITRADLEGYWQIRKSLNPTRENVDEVLTAAKCKDENNITEEEFLRLQGRAVSERFYSGDPKCDLLEALAVYDRDGDGTIDRTELKEILANHGDAFDDVINMVDTRGDGKLPIQELADQLTSDWGDLADSNKEPETAR